MEAKLQEQLNDHLHFRKLKCCLKFHMFALDLTVSVILKFKIVDIQKVGHGVQILQLQRSMASIKVCYILIHIFALVFTVSEI